MVVVGFCIRGGSKSTRSEELVVSAVVSCLGGLQGMGMNTGGSGSGDCLKRGILWEYGGVRPSKDPGI